MKNYFNCMNRLDEGIGMVLKNLEETGNRNNTLIIYISDHGADFPRGKGSCYENGPKIPMIVNYPKRFKNSVESRFVSTLDILPTMMQEAGLQVPENLPGRPLQDLETAKNWRTHIHTFTTGSSPNLLYLQFAVRDERYKLIYNPYRDINKLAVSRYLNSKIKEEHYYRTFVTPPEFELFDLEKDPHEFENLAGRSGTKEIQERLFRVMKAFQKEIKDPFYSKENMQTFQDEQKKHLKINYRKKAGFKWPHLDLFRKANGE